MSPDTASTNSGMHIAFVSARLGARLARDTDRPCDDISRDSVALALAAADARAARFTARPTDYQNAIARMAAIAELYGAAVIEANDPSGMIVGLELAPNTTHRSGHDQNWFYLA